MSEIKIRISATTNVGAVRKNNEDNYIVCQDLSQAEWTQGDDFAALGSLGSLLVVADGMGGANAGEVASAIAIDTIRQLFLPEMIATVKDDDHLIQQFMKDAVTTADLAILEQSKADKSKEGMGTTLIIAWILNRRVYICWCGDSRCYLFRSATNAMYRLTRDHSYVQELVDRGELHPDLAFDHPMSNVIMRCLGDSDRRADPETRICELQNGDTLLLCTDGLCGLCRDQEIADLLSEHVGNLDVCCNELIAAALSAGGHDNVTVALASLQMDEDFASDTQDEEFEGSKKSEKDELKKTLPSLKASDSPQKEQRSGHRWWWLLLLLVLGFALYWYVNHPILKSETEPHQEELITPQVPSSVKETDELPQPNPEQEDTAVVEPSKEVLPAEQPELKVPQKEERQTDSNQQSVKEKQMVPEQKQDSVKVPNENVELKPESKTEPQQTEKEPNKITKVK